jgi:HD-like signal output (HDOD) protein
MSVLYERPARKPEQVTPASEAEIEPDAEPGGAIVLDDLLASLDDMPAQRPVAARLVSMADDENVSAAQLAAVASHDATLTAKLMKLANSAFYGLSGRVRTVPQAVAVLGFTTVRSLAVAAAAGVDEVDAVPDGFWPRSATTAVASSELSRLFSLPAPDSFCLGLLAGIGQALLYRSDRESYLHVLEAGTTRRKLFAAELKQYGTTHLRASAAALESWNFPAGMSTALYEVDASSPSQTSSSVASLLRVAIEVADRVANPAVREDARRLSCGKVGEEEIDAVVKRAPGMGSGLVRAVTS